MRRGGRCWSWRLAWSEPMVGSLVSCVVGGWACRNYRNDRRTELGAFFAKFARFDQKPRGTNRPGLNCDPRSVVYPSAHWPAAASPSPSACSSKGAVVFALAGAALMSVHRIWNDRSYQRLASDRNSPGGTSLCIESAVTRAFWTLRWANAFRDLPHCRTGLSNATQCYGTQTPTMTVSGCL